LDHQEESTMRREPILLQSVQKEELDDGRLVLRVKVRNREQRTLHAYGSVRRIQYDSATKTLTLSLHDGHIGEDSPLARHLKEPLFVALEPDAETEVAIRVHGVINRLVPASEPGKAATVEKLRIREAEHTHIEIGCQDTPFYFNPNGPSIREQLTRWTGAVGKATFDLRPTGNKGKRGKKDLDGSKKPQQD